MGRSTSERISGRRRPRRTVWAAAIVVALVLGALASACAPDSPQAILNVPGTYVADLWSPPPGIVSTGPGATVLMCLDSTSAVLLETGDGSDGWIGSIDLDWNGTKYHADNGGSSVTMTTPVLDPGCGLLHFGVDCCHVDNHLAIRATKV